MKKTLAVLLALIMLLIVLPARTSADTDFTLVIEGGEASAHLETVSGEECLRVDVFLLGTSEAKQLLSIDFNLQYDENQLIFVKEEAIEGPLCLINGDTAGILYCAFASATGITLEENTPLMTLWFKLADDLANDTTIAFALETNDDTPYASGLVSNAQIDCTVGTDFIAFTVQKEEPSESPTATATATATATPTATPTTAPTATPTTAPSATPTVKPTATPTVKPTAAPTAAPSATPTVKPTTTPTAVPTTTPTMKPTATPTVKPTATPTVKPTATPTVKPTATPTVTPTTAPTTAPTATPEPKNVVIFAAGNLPSGSTVEVNGVPYSVTDGKVILPDGVKADLITAYTYNKSSADAHEVYPTGMTVWTVETVNGVQTAKRLSDLDNILQYAGSSIRITGKKGIRMITSVPKDKKAQLTGKGISEYTLLEYGTVVAWDSELKGEALTLTHSAAKKAYAYKKGAADPVFKDTGKLVQYTNVLVGMTNEKCVPDLAMRPYMILQNSKGAQVIIYGGTIHRSIGYIAYQNRNAFKPGNAAYTFIWDIIHYVYGTKYDADYKK